MYKPAEDSFLLESVISKYAKNKIVLDIGSGSGILAETAQKSGAKSVLATDINSKVISHLRKNGITARKSDLFSNVKEKFNLILFNPPYLPEDAREDKESRTITTGGKNGDEIILRFLHQALYHLIRNGIILLLISSLTPRKRILTLLKERHLKKTKIAEKKLFMEKLEVWKVSLNQDKS